MLGRIACVVAAAAISGCGAGDATRDPSAGAACEHRDSEVGLHISYPCSWSRASAPLTSSIDPRQVVALATFPLRGGGKGGPCVSTQADLAAMPADGAMIWLLEYRPSVGDVWADLPRSRFPPRPERFQLSRTDLQPDVCGADLGAERTFRDADRPFQLWLFAGRDVTDARLTELGQILDGLRLEVLPPPPTDPYAGWPLINDNPGDSLRVPPNWAAAAAMFPPAATRRPRPLFFASNRPLSGLPDRLVPHVDELPGPWPAEAVANEFPDDGVLVWVVEEPRGGDPHRFPPIDRDWPSADDFAPGEVLTKPNPELRWLRAGGTFRGHLFSVWIAAAPEATAGDRGLALKSASSLAVSGCWRDGFDDCPDG